MIVALPVTAQRAPSFAQHARLASRSLLLDIATAGRRLVAVGERGNVLLSDDRGQTWAQATSVPTQALLTGVCFRDPQHGVAVGHDEVILTTSDAGRTWSLVHFAPEAQQPLLDVACVGGERVIAVGAYGTYFTSLDGGVTWMQRKLDHDFHLNKIVAASTTRLYIAAESGHLYRSDDAGDSWRELPSPYEGSFFGVTPLKGDVVLACGLRGNLFRSEDAGASWHRIDSATQALLNNLVRLEAAAGPAGATQVAAATQVVAAVGLSGVVLVSHDDGQSFAVQQQPDRKGLSAAADVGDDTLVVVGEGGARLIKLAPAAAAP